MHNTQTVKVKSLMYTLKIKWNSLEKKIDSNATFSFLFPNRTANYDKFCRNVERIENNFLFLYFFHYLIFRFNFRVEIFLHCISYALQHFVCLRIFLSKIDEFFFSQSFTQCVIQVIKYVCVKGQIFKGWKYRENSSKSNTITINNL